MGRDLPPRVGFCLFLCPSPTLFNGCCLGRQEGKKEGRRKGRKEGSLKPTGESHNLALSGDVFPVIACQLGNIQGPAKNLNFQSILIDFCESPSPSLFLCWFVAPRQGIDTVSSYRTFK